MNERVAVGGAIGGNPLIPAFKATGAFTVANLNDSNANGKVDSVLDEREMINDPQFPGSGEVDLMRLDVTAPADSMVTLTVSPGAVNSVRLWRTSLKGGGDPVLDANGMGIGKSSSVDVAPGTYWVELAGVSGAIGDVKIEGKLGQATDTVEATAIWTKYNPAQTHAWPDGYFMKDNTGLVSLAGGLWALPNEADGKQIRHAYDRYTKGKGLGELDRVHTLTSKDGVKIYRTANYELSKFEILPAGMTPFVSLGIVHFDPSRTVEYSSAYDGGAPVVKTKSLWLDNANDDPHGKDSDSDLVYNSGSKAVNHIFAHDGPGSYEWAGIPDEGGKPAAVVEVRPGGVVVPRTEHVGRFNFWEFVRVQIGGPFEPGNGLKGSRSSVYYTWHSMVHIIATPPDATSPDWYMKRTNAGVTENRIAVGHININSVGGL